MPIVSSIENVCVCVYFFCMFLIVVIRSLLLFYTHFFLSSFALWRSNACCLYTCYIYAVHVYIIKNNYWRKRDNEKSVNLLLYESVWTSMNAAYKWASVKTEKFVWLRSRFTISRLPMPIIIIIYYYDYNHYYYWDTTLSAHTHNKRKKKNIRYKRKQQQKIMRIVWLSVCNFCICGRYVCLKFTIKLA